MNSGKCGSQAQSQPGRSLRSPCSTPQLPEINSSKDRICTGYLPKLSTRTRTTLSYVRQMAQEKESPATTSDGLAGWISNAIVASPLDDLKHDFKYGPQFRRWNIVQSILASIYWWARRSLSSSAALWFLYRAIRKSGACKRSHSP